MLYYLDTNIVIYAVEGEPGLQQRVRNHVAALEAAGHRFGVGELTWTECLVSRYVQALEPCCWTTTDSSSDRISPRFH